MKITIRDLMLLTAIASVCLAWWLDHRSQSQRLATSEQLCVKAKEDRSDAIRDRANMMSLTLELMKDLDVIHPGWRGTRWRDIEKPIQLHTDARLIRQRGKAWSAFQSIDRKDLVDTKESP
jgi:hypothetical protein